MGAFRGSISYTKFHVDGELPKRFRERFLERIRLRAFRPLDPKEDVEHRVGWCAIDDPFDLDLTPEKVLFNDYLNLGFRMDRWRIPSPMLKAAMRSAERELLAKRGTDKLSRAQKKNLQAVVVAQLRKKLVPAMRASDVSWSLGSGVVRFFQKSAKQNELLIELFEQTFELALVPDGAYVAAERRGLPKRIVEALPKLEPEVLAAGLPILVGDA